MLVRNIEEEISSKLVHELAKEVDWQILSSIFEESGWVSIKLERGDKSKIVPWLKANCKGKWRSHNYHYIFEDVKDANWFTIKWLS